MAGNERSMQATTALSSKPSSTRQPLSTSFDVVRLNELQQQIKKEFDRLAAERAKIQTERRELEQQCSAINDEAAFAIKQVQRLEQEATRAVILNSHANITLREAAIMRQQAALMLRQVAKEREEIDLLRSGYTIPGTSAVLTTSNASNSQRNSAVTVGPRHRPDLGKELPALPKHIVFETLPTGRPAPKPPARKSPAPKRKREKTESVQPPPGFKPRVSFEQRMDNLAACHSALAAPEPIFTAPALIVPKTTAPSAPDGDHPRPAPMRRVYRRSPVSMLRPPPKFNPRPKESDRLTFREHLAMKGIKVLEDASTSAWYLPEAACPEWAVDDFNRISSGPDESNDDPTKASPTLPLAYRRQTGQLMERPQRAYVSTKWHSTIYLRPSRLSSSTLDGSDQSLKSPTDRPAATNTSQLTPVALLRPRFGSTESFITPGIKNHRTRSPSPVPQILESRDQQKAKLSGQQPARTSPHTPPDQLIPSDIDAESEGDADDELDDDISDLDTSGPGVLGGGDGAKEPGGVSCAPYERPDWLSGFQDKGIIPRRMSGVDEISSSSDYGTTKRHVRKISDKSDKTIVPTHRQIVVLSHKCDDVFGNSSDQLPVISPGAYGSDTSSFGAGSSLMSDELRASTRRWIGCVPASRRPPMPKSYTSPGAP